MLEILFIISISIITYTYVLYPIGVYVFSIMVSLEKYDDEYEPDVTILICAYNEDKYVTDKINNALGLDYPKDKLKIVFVSDGSSDATLDKARAISSQNLTIIEIEERHGKAHAINIALEQINSEIVILTDANVFIDHMSVKELVKPLSNNSVGCVSGNVRLKAVTTGEILGEGLYMKYERMIFRSESIIKTMVGIDGGMFAIRSKLLSPLPDTIILDDMLMAMRALLMNNNIKYQESATAIELVPALVSQEFKRKVRIATGAFQLLKYIKGIFIPWRDPVAFIFFVSHKLLRWFSPIFLIVVFLIPFSDLSKSLYQILLYLQAAFYLAAILGYLMPTLREKSLVYFPYYFVTINFAMLLGLLKFLLGKHSVMWDKVNR